MKGGTSLLLRVNTDDAAKLADVEGVIRRRLRDVGINPSVRAHWPVENQFLVMLPKGVDVDRAKAMLANNARLEIKIVEGGPAPDEQTLRSSQGGSLPDAMEIVPGTSGTGNLSRVYYLVQRAAVITSADVVNAKPTVDEYNLSAISFTLSDSAVATFARVTGENVGRQLAIMLDGVVVSAPSILERITTAGVTITGTFTKQEAANLAAMLRNGSLPASITFLEQTVTK